MYYSYNGAHLEVKRSKLVPWHFSAWFFTTIIEYFSSLYIVWVILIFFYSVQTSDGHPLNWWEFGSCCSTMELKIASLIIVLVILTIFQDSVSNIISEMENEKTNNNTLDFFPMGRIHGGFRDGKIVRKIKRCPSMYTKSLNENICLRYV